MTEFQKKLLNKLLDKFEKRKISDVSEKIRPVKIKCRTDSLFSDYFGKKAYLYRPDIEDQLFALEENGFIFSERTKEGGLISVSLNLYETEKIFSVLERTSVQSVDNICLDYINEEILKIKLPVASAFLTEMQNLISLKKGHKLWFETVEDLRKITKMVCAVEEHTGEELLRNFSKRNFDDSKIFEQYSNMVMKVFNTFGEEEFSNFDDLISFYGIFKNPGAIQIKGAINLILGKQEIDVENLGCTFYLPEDEVDSVRIGDVFSKNIITVENLTTYNTIKQKNSVIVYLGGFASHSKIKFLKKLKRVSHDCCWYHFSDIDVGGFRIFNDLKTKTEIDFEPFMMTSGELETYKNQCQHLTAKDVDSLMKMRNNPAFSMFFETIDYMLENDIKLEQESITHIIFHPWKDVVSNFCEKTHTFVFNLFSVWYSSTVHMNCEASVECKLQVTDKRIFKKVFEKEKINESPSRLFNIVHCFLEEKLQSDFGYYVTEDDYYPPVVEDYVVNCEEYLTKLCSESGLNVEYFTYKSDSSDFVPN